MGRVGRKVGDTPGSRVRAWRPASKAGMLGRSNMHAVQGSMPQAARAGRCLGGWVDGQGGAEGGARSAGSRPPCRSNKMLALAATISPLELLALRIHCLQRKLRRLLAQLQRREGPPLRLLHRLRRQRGRRQEAGRTLGAPGSPGHGLTVLSQQRYKAWDAPHRRHCPSRAR